MRAPFRVARITRDSLVKFDVTPRLFCYHYCNLSLVSRLVGSELSDFLSGTTNAKIGFVLGSREGDANSLTAGVGLRSWDRGEERGPQSQNRDQDEDSTHFARVVSTGK